MCSLDGWNGLADLLTPDEVMRLRDHVIILLRLGAVAAAGVQGELLC